MNLTRKDKVGVTILGALILIGIVLLNVKSHFYVPDPTEIDESKLSFFSLNDEKPKDISKDNPKHFLENSYVLEDFDPNDYTVKEWKKIGFSEKQAESIVNYKNNYGPFVSKKDIQKLYVISDEKYTEIAPFLRFSNHQERSTSDQLDARPEKEKEFREPLLSIDLNTASKDELILISGIGDVYAKRILKYRDLIGGFVEEEQLDELYISEEAKVVLKENSVIDPLKVQKVDVNTVSKESLKKIPFMTWEVMALILKERDRKGRLESLDFLPKDKLNEETRKKMTYYLNF